MLGHRRMRKRRPPSLSLPLKGGGNAGTACARALSFTDSTPPPVRLGRHHHNPTAAPVTFLTNPHINRLAAHSTLHQLAWCISGVFFGVFLLGAGISPAVIFLSIAGIRVVRF